MDNEKLIDEILSKIDAGKLTEKQKDSLHEKVLKLDLEDVLSIMPAVFKAGIIDKRDGQVLFEELLQRHDRVVLYPMVFECLAQKANFLGKKELENLKAEVCEWAPIDTALEMVDILKNTNLLSRDEIEHIASRVLSQEHISCYSDAVYTFFDLDVFTPDDLEFMWQSTMAVGELRDCINLAEALKDEDIVDKKEIQSLFDEAMTHLSELNIKDDSQNLEAQIVVAEVLKLVNAFADQKLVSQKMALSAKAAILQVYKNTDSEIEMMNFLANILGKNPFSAEELDSAKKRFVKELKDAVKKTETEFEKANANKKTKKPKTCNYQNMVVPIFGPALEEEDYVINWKNVFSSADKKLFKELALKTQNIDIYGNYVLIWQEGIEELDDLFADCDCDCEMCSGCH